MKGLGLPNATRERIISKLATPSHGFHSQRIYELIRLKAMQVTLDKSAYQTQKCTIPVSSCLYIEICPAKLLLKIAYTGKAGLF